jgi:hypothetical protein
MTTTASRERQAIRWCHYTTMHVYALCEPDTGEVRYIGRSYTPYSRCVQHRHSPNSCVREWVLGLKDKGLSPVVRILHSVRGLYKAQDMERLEIAVHVMQFGDRILNAHGRSPRPRDIVRVQREWKRRYATHTEATP